MEDPDFGGWGMPASVYGMIVGVALVLGAISVFIGDRLIDAWRRAARKWRSTRRMKLYKGTIYKSKGNHKR